MKFNLYLEFDFNPEETHKLANIKTVRNNLCQLLKVFVIKYEWDVWLCSFIHSFIHSIFIVEALCPMRDTEMNYIGPLL